MWIKGHDSEGVFNGVRFVPRSIFGSSLSDIINVEDKTRLIKQLDACTCAYLGIISYSNKLKSFNKAFNRFFFFCFNITKCLYCEMPAGAFCQICGALTCVNHHKLMTIKHPMTGLMEEVFICKECATRHLRP